MNIVPNLSKKPNERFLGKFAELRKATISFVMYVRLSVRDEQIDSHWTDFITFYIQDFFQNLSRKLKFY